MTDNARRNALQSMRENPKEPLAFIPVAPLRDEKKESQAAKRKAKRQAYDKAYPVVSFFVPRHLHETAKDIKGAIARLAFDNFSTEASVSLAFVKWSLGKVKSGELRLTGHPDAQRRKMAVTLTDADQSAWPTPQETPEYQHTKKSKSMRLGWRWPADVKKQLTAISSDTMPVGEVTILLLEFALKSYRTGKAKIKTQSMDVRQNAVMEDR